MARLIAQPNPLRRSERFFCDYPPEISIAEMLGRVSDRIYVEVDGVPIPPSAWEATRPADEALVVAVAVPQGPLKIPIFVTIAQSVASAAVAAGVSGTIFGMGAAALIGEAVAGLAMVGLSMGMSMAVNALIKPQAPSLPSGADYSGSSRYTALTGGANRLARYEPIPVLYGTYRIAPPLGALFYTETAGNAQYLRGLLCLGYGPMSVGGHTVGTGYPKIGRLLAANQDHGDANPYDLNTTLPADTIRIGETDLYRYKAFEWEICGPADLSLYTSDVAEQSLSIDFKHTQPVGQEGGWFADGQSVTRTTDDDAQEISIDIAFPAGMISIGKDGVEELVKVEWKIEYAPAGSGTWTTVIDPWTIEAKQRGPKRVHKKWKAPAPGRYDVRLTRIRTHVIDNEILQSDAVWTALRSVRAVSPWNADPAKGGLANVVLMAFRIRSTGQLNGNLDAISILASAVYRQWNGSGFVWGTSSSAAWAYAHALTGPQLQRPVADSRIDWDGARAWADQVTDHHYNWYHTGDESLVDRIRAIARAGMAEWSLREGLFAVVRDNQFTPIGLIGPRNSRNFQFEKSFPKIPHALRVKYIDPATWQEAERLVLDDGYQIDGKDAWGNAAPGLPVATFFEAMETQGCTDQNEAFLKGRYYLAAMRLRPEKYTVEQDFEALRVTRGDCVRLAHDVLLVGLSHGRVKSVTLNGSGQATALTLDEEVFMEAGKSYSLRLRTQSGTLPLVAVATVAGTASAVTLASPTAGISAGDLFTFGESGTESMLAKVTDIQYRADLSATLKLVPAAPDILDAGTGLIPDFDPLITIPVALRLPATPILVSVSTLGESLRTLDNGTFVGALVAQWWMPAGPVRVAGFEVLYYGAGMDPKTIRIMQEDALSAALPDVPVGLLVAVQVRAVSMYGRWGEYSDIGYATLTPGSLVAEPPTDLALTTRVTVRLDGTVDYDIQAAWNAPSTGLVDHYELEYKRSADAIWKGVNVSRSAREYLILQLVVDTAYDVRVRTVNAIGGASDWVTGSATVAVKDQPPGAPSGLAAANAVQAIQYPGPCRPIPMWP
jgi:hypothetical protein